MPVVGFLNSASPNPMQTRGRISVRIEPDRLFRGSERGYEYRWAEGRSWPTAALGERSNSTSGDRDSRYWEEANCGFRRQGGTATSPIVFANGMTRSSSRIVSKLSRPGGNATGVSFFHSPLGAKRVGCCANSAPVKRPFAFLANRTIRLSETDYERCGERWLLASGIRSAF